MSKHNFLLIKKKSNLRDYEKLLYDAYSTTIRNILLIASKLKSKEFDPIKILFWGLDNIPKDEDYKKKYLSILEITEYFHAAKGQRGKFLEKMLALKSKNGICSIRLSEIPLWLENPKLFAKKKIFNKEKLTNDEKLEMKNLNKKWKFLGGKDDNIDFDIGHLNKDQIILFEQKNRVDSGGTSARREIFSAKVLPLLRRIKSDKDLFEINKKEKLNFEEFIKKVGIKKLIIFDGILFNKDGTSATVEGDKRDGFYSSRKSEFRETLNFLNQNNEYFEILNSDEKDLSINIKIKDSNLEISMGVAYGDDIPKKLLSLDFSLQDTIIPGFDDLWLAFKMGVEEREALEKNGDNNILKLIGLSKTDKQFKDLCNIFREKEGDQTALDQIIKYLGNKRINIENKYLEDLIFLLIETKII